MNDIWTFLARPRILKRMKTAHRVRTLARSLVLWFDTSAVDREAQQRHGAEGEPDGVDGYVGKRVEDAGGL